jgi:hypothetical protein
MTLGTVRKEEVGKYARFQSSHLHSIGMACVTCRIGSVLDCVGMTGGAPLYARRVARSFKEASFSASLGTISANRSYSDCSNCFADAWNRSVGRRLGKLVEHFDRMITRHFANTARFQVLKLFTVLAMFRIHDQTTTGECMCKRANFTNGTTRGWLSSQTRWCVAGTSEVATEQVHAMDERIDCGPYRVLVHAHAP